MVRRVRYSNLGDTIRTFPVPVRWPGLLARNVKDESNAGSDLSGAQVPGACPTEKADFEESKANRIIAGQPQSH